MFDFLRNLSKSEEERRQETLTAYLDDALAPAEKERFERLLAADESLRASLEEQRLISASLRRLPRMRAPRNFTLDPAVHGRPVVSTADRLYPVMRVATAVVAILFVVVLVIDFVPFGADQETSSTVAESVQFAADAVEEAAEEAPMAEPMVVGTAVALEALEVTRLVEEEESVAAEEAEMPAAVQPSAEEPAAEEPAAEEAADEVAEAEIEEAAPPPGPESAGGGGGAPAETPLAMLVSPTKEGRAATTEASEGRAAGEPPQPLDGTAEAALPTTDNNAILTKEAASRPTASPAASAFALEQQTADDGKAGETAAGQVGIALSTTQIMAIVLGLALVVLAVITLLLRRRAR